MKTRDTTGSETREDKKRRTRAILTALRKEFPEAACALHHESPFELLVATILSAQCTDERVNLVTPALFATYPDAHALAGADPDHLMGLIRSTGFFRNKARNLIACARAIVERHGGDVPQSMEQLASLPGVGRKTANVVLGTAFGIPGLPVDTHVKRLSRLLRLTEAEDPDDIERDLCALIPKSQWTEAGHLLILHGRKTCIARRPRCAECMIAPFCPSAVPVTADRIAGGRRTRGNTALPIIALHDRGGKGSS
ncbi:MAG: endonuclease III [Bacteroidota bacterium]|nr:endonuclease III [Bacteroidota bacterium]